MTLNELRYFVALAEECDPAKAAQRCRVKKITLQAAVRRLESGLATRLFETLAGALCLTERGEAIYQRATRALGHSKQIELLCNASAQAVVQPLALGAEPELAPYYFPALLPLWRQRHAQAHLDLVQAETQALSARLAQGQLDVLLVSLPFSAPDSVTRVLFEEPLVALMTAEHPLAAQLALGIENLHGHALVLPTPGTRLHRDTLQACPDLWGGLEQGWAQCAPPGTSLDTLRGMVAAGLGVALVPVSAASGLARMPGTLVTRPFRDPAIARRVALVWRASFPGHASVDALATLFDVLNPSLHLEPMLFRASAGLMVDNTRW